MFPRILISSYDSHSFSQHQAGTVFIAAPALSRAGRQTFHEGSGNSRAKFPVLCFPAIARRAVSIFLTYGHFCDAAPVRARTGLRRAAYTIAAVCLWSANCGEI
jgi:hypothetical protein